MLFRDVAGAAHCLSGLCPHRMMPMELGALDNDTLECGYHGWTFDTNGTCVGSPTSPTVPNCSLARYPVVEDGPFLWFRPGDPALADTARVPPQAAIGVGAPGWRTDSVHRYSLAARYQLLIDNLFDLSHLSFVHASIVGRGIGLDEAELEDRDGRLVVVRATVDVPVDPYHGVLFPDLGGRMSSRLDTEFVGLGLISAGDAVWPGTDLTAPPRQTNFVHGLTPETETTTHYWIMTARNFRTDDEGLSGVLCAQMRAVADQDVVALEAIERLLQQQDSALPREISMKSDAGALRARLRVIQMIRAEDSLQQTAAVG